MDPLTQASLGGAIGAAFFHRKLGRRAVLFGALAGMSPDLDVLVGLWGDEWTTLAAHRGPSHSLVVLPFVAVPLGLAACRLFGRAEQRWVWIHLAFWALITHPLLDVFTTYGTQLLSPLSDRRFIVDAVAIVDPLFTLPLFIAMLSAYGRRASAQGVEHWGRFALGWACVYLAVGYALTLGAQQAARTQLAGEGFEAVAVRAWTPLFAPGLRRVTAYDVDGEFRVGYRSCLAPRPIRWTAFRSEAGPRIDVALRSRGGRVFRWFSGGFTQSYRRGDEVVLADRRYAFVSAPEQTPFLAVARFDADGHLVSVSQESGLDRRRLSLERELETAWMLMLGLDPWL